MPPMQRWTLRSSSSIQRCCQSPPAKVHSLPHTSKRSRRSMQLLRYLRLPCAFGKKIEECQGKEDDDRSLWTEERNDCPRGISEGSYEIAVGFSAELLTVLPIPAHLATGDVAP